MDKFQEVRKCVEKWVEIRPVLDGWLKYSVSTSASADYQSITITVDVPTRFSNTKNEIIHYYQRYQISLVELEYIKEDLPNYISHVMQKLVNELTMSTIQPKIEDIYLTPVLKEYNALEI